MENNKLIQINQQGKRKKIYTNYNDKVAEGLSLYMYGTLELKKKNRERLEAFFHGKPSF